ncbi:hypothetical protein B0H17DRAFT_1196106 [Mycena rosella]|uniref:Uncharacterized protein n=1 Tax=Mycena rosella TaxID=1033263 RepID=A0AAD7DVR4_MYCRO|nr:hypothetical protein B0H17DRAFT_1196106 [Mycena rosella]
MRYLLPHGLSFPGCVLPFLTASHPPTHPLVSRPRPVTFSRLRRVTPFRLAARSLFRLPLLHPTVQCTTPFRAVTTPSARSPPPSARSPPPSARFLAALHFFWILSISISISLSLSFSTPPHLLTSARHPPEGGSIPQAERRKSAQDAVFLVGLYRSGTSPWIPCRPRIPAKTIALPVEEEHDTNPQLVPATARHPPIR